MTRETRDRIRNYKKMMPQIRTRVTAAALMLVMALSISITASYAWVTLSAVPEAKSLATTVTGNGNLEIALATSPNPPGASGRGDSTAAGNGVTNANTTWGNLINLSDPSYGISNITLRPAALNGTTGLLTNPLYGVEYGEDGRVVAATGRDDFAFCYYDQGNEDTGAAFLVDMDNSHWGVRAISTVTYENLQGSAQLKALVDKAYSKQREAQTAYQTMTSNDKSPGAEYISALEGLIQVYAQAQIDGNLSNQDLKDYIPDMCDMMVYMFDNVMVPTGESYVAIADMYTLYEEGVPSSGYTVETLCEAAVQGTLPDYIPIDSLLTFAQDYRQLKIYTDPNPSAANQKYSLVYWKQQAEAGSPVYWKDVQSIVNWVADINTCTVNGYTMNQIASHALELLGGGTKRAKLNNGALKRVEQRIEQKMAPEISITVDASSIVSFVGKVTLDAVVTTNAEAPYELPADIEKAVAADPGGGYKGDSAVAEDTYALALDFWVRTNAGAADGAEATTTTTTGEDGSQVTTITNPIQSFLTLEGHVITQTTQEPVMVLDITGTPQPAYTISWGDKKVDGYKREDTYYVISNGQEISVNDLAAQNGVDYNDITFTPQLETITQIIGYEGANRVWSEEQMEEFLNGDGTSTTQGSGSCYVFYANNEADQKRFLELLRAMKVVFIDGNGRQIGYATMDTENYYAQSGRVIVPLKLDASKSTYLGEDAQGEDIYGLMPLEKDAVTRVTALVYLDGNMLDNSMVLAGGDIQGTLNIQFGSANAAYVTTTTTNSDGTSTSGSGYVLEDDSLAIRDEELMDDVIKVSAQVDKTDFVYDKDTPAATNLSVTVEGVEPQRVEARFVRAISSTQGALQAPIALTQNGNVWTANAQFQTPGVYELRSVWVDGVEYPLGQVIRVTVLGSTVNSVSCEATGEGNWASIMTADTRFETNLTLGFTTSDQEINTVRGIFLDETGRQVTVVFTLNADGTTWSGKAAFSSSGTYTMQYVEVNGEQYEVAKELQPTLNLMLGLKLEAYITTDEETLAALKAINPVATPTRFTLDPGKLPTVPLTISAKILDNRNTPIESLNNVQVVYGKTGSATQKLDANLVWDNQAGAYVGKIMVDAAGTYTFKSLTVGENVLSSATGATSIQAMPPEDVSYFDNHTPVSQTKLNGGATVTLGLAYSNAASKVEAVISNGQGFQEIVEGKQLYEDVEHQGDKSVTLWEFPVPAYNGSQDGNWQVMSLNLYGVYYDDVYYEEEPVVLDMQSQNIRTRVVHKIYVTVSGTTQTWTGEFMTDHPVDNMTVTIADFAGEPLGEAVENLKLNYFLDYTSVADGQFGYTSSDVQATVVSNTGFSQQSSGVYTVTGLNFQIAGIYKNMDLSFALDGTNYTKDNMRISYMVDGKSSGAAPQYTVHWTAPTVTIVGTSPAGATPDNPNGGEEFMMNIHSGGGTNLKEYAVHNYFDTYTATVHYEVRSLFGMATGYNVSSATFRITGAGNLQKAEIVIKNNTDANYSNYVTFNSNNSDVTSNVGGIEGSTRKALGESTVSDITLTYGEQEFVMQLSHPLTLVGRATAPAKVTYRVAPEYEGLFNLPANKNPLDGRTFTAEFPLLTAKKMVYEAVGEVTSVEMPRTVTKNITWTTQENAGCGSTETVTHYGTVTYTYADRQETGTFKAIERTYQTKTWTMTTTQINEIGTVTTSTKNAGTSVKITAHDNVITPNVTYTDVDTGEVVTETIVVEGPLSSTVFKEGNTVISEPSGWREY